jgi:hypothetical protein
VEKSIEHNPNFGPMLYRFIAMYKVKVGLVKEGQELFANYSKELPDSKKNLRYIMSRFRYKDPQVLKSFAEGYIKAGLPGELGDYYIISSKNKLSGEELKRLFFGHKVTGLTLGSNKQWSVERSEDGKATIQDGKKSDTGKSWVEDDMLCDQWDSLYESLNDCWVVYRNPKGTPENKDEYLGAPGYGLYPFTLVK